MNLLDTNVCVDLLRRRSPRVVARLRAADIDQLAISSITAAELFAGALKSARAKENVTAVSNLVSSIATLSFGSEAARFYGLVRSDLERIGQTIGPLDMLIAGHAASVGATLITNNTREFARVPGLPLKDWTR